MQYLPFGKRIKQSETERLFQEKKFQLYDYYGIPYGIFDESGDDIMGSVEEDRAKAKLLIMQGLEIPHELECRLLQYKQQEPYWKGRANTDAGTADSL